MMFIPVYRCLTSAPSEGHVPTNSIVVIITIAAKNRCVNWWFLGENNTKSTFQKCTQCSAAVTFCAKVSLVSITECAYIKEYGSSVGHLAGKSGGI